MAALLGRDLVKVLHLVRDLLMPGDFPLRFALVSPGPDFDRDGFSRTHSGHLLVGFLAGGLVLDFDDRVARQQSGALGFAVRSYRNHRHRTIEVTRRDKT